MKRTFSLPPLSRRPSNSYVRTQQKQQIVRTRNKWKESRKVMEVEVEREREVGMDSLRGVVTCSSHIGLNMHENVRRMVATYIHTHTHTHTLSLSLSELKSAGNRCTQNGAKHG
jgi:hypothetical protein